MGLGEDTDTDELVQTLRATMLALTAGPRPNLSTRQLAVFIFSYLDKGPPTLHRLEAHRQVPRPDISLILDRLTERKLVARSPEPEDRRSIQVARTANGLGFLRELRAIMDQAAAR